MEKQKNTTLVYTIKRGKTNITIIYNYKITFHGGI